MNRIKKVLLITRLVIKYCGNVFAENPFKAIVFLTMFGAILNASIGAPLYLTVSAFPLDSLVHLGLFIVGSVLSLAWFANLGFVFWAIINFTIGMLSSRNSPGAVMFSSFLRKNNQQF